MRIFVKDNGFYRQLVSIAVPTALQNLIIFGVSMADTVMLGMLGEVQLSATSNANQLGFIYMLFTFGLGSGSNVLIAQYWGKGDRDSIHKVITIMYRILFMGSIVFTAVAVLLSKQVMMVFTPDTAVISDGARFLRIVGISYFLTGISSTTIIMLRSVRSVNISLVVYICSLVTNVMLNWILIFGKLGAPALGVEGAAIATCIARFVEFTITVIYMLYFEKKIQYKLKLLFVRKLNILGHYIKNSLPVVFNEMMWGAGIALVSVVIGRMGREFTAANSICTVLSQLVTIALFGVANAAAVIVGNTVGGGDYEKAKAYSTTLLAVSFLLGLFSMGVVLVLKGPMLRIYNISDLAKTYADQIMTIYAFVVICVAVAATSMVGVLRGGGDTRFVLLMDLIFLWGFAIPMGFFTGLYLHWPVWAVYIVIKSDELLKSIFVLIRIAKGRWINDLTRNIA